MKKTLEFSLTVLFILSTLFLYVIEIGVTFRTCGRGGQYLTYTHTHTQPFNGLLSWTTPVGRYQKKHLPTHTHPDHRTSFITLLNLFAFFLFRLLNGKNCYKCVTFRNVRVKWKRGMTVSDSTKSSIKVVMVFFAFLIYFLIHQ